MSSPPPNTSPATLLQTIQPALFLLVPLFALALLLLALSHKPNPNAHTRTTRGAYGAYGFIAALCVLSTLAGALPLSHATNGHKHAEGLIQGLLFLLLGVPVLHLPSCYDSGTGSGTGNQSQSQSHPSAIRTVHFHPSIPIPILVIALSSATLLALLAPFLPAIPLYLPPRSF
ncbi:hypothetical protein B0H34DRAFT_189783 [Crassisporium funariophilum]|nr:hypothetical protein B0H34DRAFT_189783 [Crassisporium funariophilum]